MAEDYAIGGRRWPGLSKLVEEAGEVLQVAGKIMGTGGERPHWDGTDLKLRLEQELGDLIAAAHFVIAACDLDSAACEARYEAKLEKFRQWHTEQGGLLDGPALASEVVALDDVREDRAAVEQARRSAEATRPESGSGTYVPEWLEYARAKGYDEGFTAEENIALRVLEHRGLVERDPTSSGAATHWRVTEKGMRTRG